jgi:GPH family glycoside/pentoside/hexuronide:cation symporter
MNFDDYIFDPKEWKIASTGKMLSYSFGFILTLYLLSAFSSLIFYFYEVEVKLQVELVSLAIVLFTVYTIISSPLLGYLTDRPFKFSSKWGFRFPWIVGSAIPLLVFYVLLFMPPDVDPKSNPWLLFWYLVIISCVFGTFLSLFRQHFEGGFANHFREDFERRRASALAFIFPGIIMFFLNIVPLFIISYGDKSTFALAAIISAIILSICVIFLIPGIRESEEVKMRYFQGYEEERIPFMKLMKISLKQKNFIVSLISSTLVSISSALNIASGIYFFKDVLGLPLYLSVFPAITFFLALIIALPFWVSFSVKHGNVTTYKLGVFLLALAYLPYLWISTLEEAIIFAVARGIASSCFMVMVLPVMSDCYDEVTLASGKHQEATLLGIRTIFMRSSIIFQALIIAWIHIITGYNPNPGATQTASAIWGIRIHRALIPMILCFFACLVMVLWYDLEGEKKLTMKAKMRELGL